jgi:glycerophosphoryl diester phosphodiesterase
MKTQLSFVIIAFLFSCMQNSEPYRRPAVIAHRGASGIAPENTLAAVQKALDAGADMVEIDVHLSKDKKVVVMHDASVIRTTEGTEDIENMTLEAIRQLDAGAWYSADYVGERVPTLEEVLTLIQGKAILLIEIKKGRNGRYAGLEQAVIDVVDAHQAREKVIIQSFEYETVQQALQIAPDIEAHQLVTAAGGLEQYVGIAAINPYYRTLTHRFIRSPHERGLKVFTYTVNSEKEMKKCIRGRVDGIITNFPDRLVKVLKEIEES